MVAIAEPAQLIKQRVTVQNDLGKIDCPTLIIHGAEDFIVPESPGLARELIPGPEPHSPSSPTAVTTRSSNNPKLSPKQCGLSSKPPQPATDHPGSAHTHTHTSPNHICADRVRSADLVICMPTQEPRYTAARWYILLCMSKHLVDIDEQALSAARAELDTATIKDTVNEALRQAAAGRDPRVTKALDVLANADLADRAEVWR
jgi:Arc/MetJ family transcription regulator